MKITVFTIFPHIINPFFADTLLKRSLDKGLWSLNIVNIRDYALDTHRSVDDTAYGGSPGMVMRPDIIGRAIDTNCNLEDTHFFYMSPKGRHIDQEIITESLSYNNIGILCGRYEGIDERILEEYKMTELSIGDFILMGGEVAALAFIEAMIRCIPGVVNNSMSITEDSFGGNVNEEYKNLLEYPIYTKPRIWKNREVPNVLLSGNHKEIKDWQLTMAQKLTQKKRPDLWNKYLNNRDE